jgi:A/G-specific adenine glycosylase
MRKKNPSEESHPPETHASETGKTRAAGSGFHEEGKPDAETVRRLLLAAYDTGKRDLPWRGESDPYRVWVSEVMLQQTRVETVIPYYEEWLNRFPDLDSLAEAEEEDVLRVWQGLGYYSRARRLHEGARVVRERYAGALPRNSEELRGLPGIGEYTAGALASIAFGEAVPAVDGNVKRVLSRLHDLPSPTPSGLRQLAADLVDPDRPGDFNQALMELGAVVCTPRSPDCDNCPISSQCLALARDTVGERPAPKAKRPVPEVDVAVLVAAARDERDGIHFLLQKRPRTGLLAGMWEFPGVEVAGEESGSNGFSSQDGQGDSSFRDGGNRPLREAAITLARDLGLDLSGCDKRTPNGHQARPGVDELEAVTHVFSHLKVRYRPSLVVVPMSVESESDRESPRWIHADSLYEVPLPVAQSRIAGVALEFLRRSFRPHRSAGRR